MKFIALFLSATCLLTGCSVTASAVTAREKRVALVKQHRHNPKKPKKKVVLVVGTKVKKRPAKSVVIYFKNIPYLYANGVFYKSVNKDYEVIKPQIGMVVPELPEEGVTKMRMKDEVLYVYDGVLYKQIPTTRGLQYEVKGFIQE